MSSRIKRIDKELPLPEYQTDGSAAFDLYSRISVTIQPGETVDIPLNVVIETNPTQVLLLCLRSSTPKKYGITMHNSPGVIDSDYCGNDDEIMLRAYNFTKETTFINRGDRIAQGLFVFVYKAAWTEVDDMDRENRGGFGSTGN
jgi:dUTP pyrophosphatase